MLHRQLAKLFNPAVKVRIGTIQLWMPFVHPLPFLLAQHPFYDRLMPRLGVALREAKADLVIIDVGANIGDTAQITLETVQTRILAIEPDPQYFQFLDRNSREVNCITSVCAALSDRDMGDGVELTKVGGTAYISKEGGKMLDTLLLQHPKFLSPHLLKIDTDGFDLKVMLGAKALLARERPVILFELSPSLYEKVGKMDAMGTFTLLDELGYTSVIFYDNEGWLMFRAAASDNALLRSHVEYARRKGHYFDVVAIHGEDSAFGQKFFDREVAHFKSAVAATIYSESR